MLISIMYRSVRTAVLGDDDLASLWQIAIENNRNLGVTGLLYYDALVFFQLIEGPTETVENLMHRISKDPRHENVQTLAEADIVSPSFRNTPMKLIDARRSPELQNNFNSAELLHRPLNGVHASASRLARL